VPIYQSTAVGPAQVGLATTSKSTLGKDDFLKLLVQQLKAQDPLNPTQGAEFAAQLAQFSSVEQLHNISASLEASINANYVLTQAINNGLSAGFVGKEVRATGDTFNLAPPGNGQRSIKLGYSLASAANTVEVKVRNERGEVVRTLRTTGTAKGDNSFTWDGTNDAGADVPAGKYTFTVDAKDPNNATVGTSLFMFGKVSAVRFTAEGTKFLINGQEILLGSILEILGG
jgi:flagellar basal-body rod modification protein FlgD